MTGPADLQLEAAGQEGRLRLALVGELDIATAPRLREVVAALCAEGVGELLVDLRDLTFLDSTGLRALLACKEEVRGRGGVLHLTRGQRQVERLFEITGLQAELCSCELPPGAASSRSGGGLRHM